MDRAPRARPASRADQVRRVIYNPQQGIQKLVWQGLLTWVFAGILTNLDRVWTIAMWPKAPKPTMLHEAYFHAGTRLMLVAGLASAILVFLNDIDEPGLTDQGDSILPAALQFRLVGHTNKTFIQCLDDQGMERMPLGTGVWL